MLSKDEDIAALVDAIRVRLSNMEPDARMDLFARIIDGYCRWCGWESPDGWCNCTNDE